MLERLRDEGLIGRLNGMDLEPSSLVIPEPEVRTWYTGPAGREHYRFLAWAGFQFSGTNLVDLGTYKGCSALALSLNPANIVHTFDIVNKRTLGPINANVRIYHDDILKPAYRSLLLDTALIVLDTAHEGPFERQFLEHLRRIGYRGYLLADDIHLNQAMSDFWHEAVKEEKYDLSPIGHHSGTGLIVFR
jgi:hypothetical protein